MSKGDFMGAIDMFNDFVKLIESESLPVEAVAIADGDAIIAERHFVPDQDRNIYSHMKSLCFDGYRHCNRRWLAVARFAIGRLVPRVCSLRCATGVGPDHAEALADYVERFQSCVFDEP